QNGQFFADLARTRLSQAPYRDRRIELSIVHEPDRSRFVIHDDGSGFDTSKVDRPIDPDDLLRSSGRGLLLMKSFMDTVRFNAAGNQVTLIKERTINDTVHRSAATCALVDEISQHQSVPQEDSRTPVNGHVREGGIHSINGAKIGSLSGDDHSLALLSATLNGQSALEPDFYKRLLDQLHDAVYFVDTRRCILYWNDAAERLTGYTRSEVVGRHCYDGLLEHVDFTGCQLCYHECPLHRAMAQDHPVQERVMLRRKDGRRISVDVRIMPVRNNEGVVLGGVEIFRDATTSVVVESAFRQVREAADRDPLTGLANRRFLDRMLARYMEQAEGLPSPLTVIMADLDHFKQVNDNWGHAVGDQALVQFATVLQSQCRLQDLVARVGGEEFLLLLPGHPLETATIIAERLRRSTVRATPKGLGQHWLTASFGVAQAMHGEAPADLLRRADKALYRAKSNGRDRVEVEPC
ncbi:MAG: diguanylate cyclase, partial [Isosphaeraceae bacterium]